MGEFQISVLFQLLIIYLWQFFRVIKCTDRLLGGPASHFTRKIINLEIFCFAIQAKVQDIVPELW